MARVRRLPRATGAARPLRGNTTSPPASKMVMRLPIALITAALAVAFVAGPAQADSPRPTQQQKSINGVVVLIGTNDYGVVAAGPAQAFTPPIGTDKGSATAAIPTTPRGIIA